MKRRQFVAAGGALVVAFSSRWSQAQEGGPAPTGPQAARQPEGRAAPGRLDPHRCRRSHHGLHRQGRARPGHPHRAAAGRGRGTGGRAGRHHAGRPRHRTHRQRGLHRRQPFDAGQRHRDPPRRGAGPRDAAGTRGVAARRAGRAIADRRRRGQRQRPAPRLWAADRCAGAACRGRAAGHAARSEDARPRRPLDAAHRHTGQGERRRRLPPGFAPARHGPWPHRAAAERGVDPAPARHRRRGRAARGAEGGGRRSLHRRDRDPRIPGGHRAPRARRGGAVGRRDRHAACHRRPVRFAAPRAVARRRDPRGRRPGRGDRPLGRGRLPAAVPDARLDRAIVRDRATGRGQDHCLDPHPGRLPTTQGARGTARRGAGGGALHPRRGLRLLRPQRRRRRRCRCGVAGARAARAAGAGAVDARGRARRRTARAADDHARQRRTRRRRAHQGLALRGLEQHPQRTARRGGRLHRRHLPGAALHAEPAEADPAARRRRRPQCDPALHAAGCARHASLPAGDAAARVGVAVVGRVHERLVDRELHG